MGDESHMGISQYIVGDKLVTLGLFLYNLIVKRHRAMSNQPTTFTIIQSNAPQRGE